MRVLFITRSNIQQKLNSGGFIVARRNYELIKEYYGEENVKCFIIDSEVGKDSKRFKYYYREKNNIAIYLNYVFFRDGYSKKTEKKLVADINCFNPDLIFIDGSTYGGLLKKININCKIVLYMHNIEKSYSWERVINNSKLCIFRYFAYWYNEKKAVNMAAKVLCINSRDEKELMKYYKRKSDDIIPVSFADSFSETEMKAYAKKKDEPFILFVGSYFLPNYQGILWFVEHVMPYISYKLKIVGKGMEEKRIELERKNVEVIGTVDDLSEYYYAAEAIIMPIFLGSGMKVKTAEAMMYGKTIFATKEALEGYDICEIPEVYECNTKEEFISSISHALNKNNRKFNIPVRKYFLENFETDTVKIRFRKILEEIGGNVNK